MAERLEQWTEAARPEELVVFTIDMQCVWCYTYRAMHRPMQTIKTSGGSQRVMAYQKKVSKESVLGSMERTQCVDSSMVQRRRCHIVGTLGNDSLGWCIGMME